MSISSAGTEINSQPKNAKLNGENTVEVENNKGQTLKTDKVETATALPVQVESPSKVDTNGNLVIAGVRPISTSELQVVNTYNSMGIRPIGANTLDVVSSINISGIRPIASSALVVSESYSIFGNRPIASNEIDDSESLMGFLD